jgi:erythromycin esterase-like protein
VTQRAEAGRPAPGDRLVSAPRVQCPVIYRLETERQSHYFRARLADQFGAVIHIDDTGAVEPLERTSVWETGEMPETYPFGV